MAIDLASVQTFTKAELLKLARAAIAEILVAGQSNQFPGRMLTRADLRQLNEFCASMEAQIDAETVAPSGGGNVLVQYGERA